VAFPEIIDVDAHDFLSDVIILDKEGGRKDKGKAILNDFHSHAKDQPGNLSTHSHDAINLDTSFWYNDFEEAALFNPIPNGSLQSHHNNAAFAPGGQFSNTQPNFNGSAGFSALCEPQTNMGNFLFGNNIWKSTPVNLPATSAGFGVPGSGYLSSAMNAEGPQGSPKADNGDILKRFNLFKHFDIVEGHSDHHFNRYSTTQVITSIHTMFGYLQNHFPNLLLTRDLVSYEIDIH
ncbi:hypothetical protein LINGRAHAP2_LOCUS32739, partial [Linum grandiflorum]